jgi:hypothetical protein
MRMHIGRTVAALGLATLVAGGAAGTALAASGNSATAQASTASVTAVAASAQSQALVKLTNAQLAAKLGVSAKQLVQAGADFKDTVVSTHGTKSAAEIKAILVKILATDLHISSSAAEWAAGEILGGYVSN